MVLLDKVLHTHLVVLVVAVVQALAVELPMAGYLLHQHVKLDLQELVAVVEQVAVDK